MSRNEHFYPELYDALVELDFAIAQKRAKERDPEGWRGDEALYRTSLRVAAAKIQEQAEVALVRELAHRG